MNLWIDEFAYLDSPLHRWNPRGKLLGLFALIFAFSLVSDVRFLPVMFAVTAALFAVSGLPVRFLWSRLRYPGLFLLIMAFILPLTGQTVLVAVGPVAVYQEGLLNLLLIASRFTCILTIGLLMFGTGPFLETLNAMRALGLPPTLADMTLLSWRYLFEVGETLATMERAMRLRGFRAGRLSLRGLSTLASLAGSLLIRSYEQSERVYHAMKLRGYGQPQSSPTPDPAVSAPDHAGASDHADVSDHVDVSESTVALTVSDLTFAYPGGAPVLTGVDFELWPGERVGLIGPNGAGKTSIFLLVSGLLQADAGAITLYGEPVRKGAFRPDLGLVFQNPTDQLFSPSVRDDVAFGPINMGLAEADVEARVAQALATTGTQDLADRPPHHLSGGEKRMVSIASVLAMQPQLLVFDEPDANLDMQARRRLIRFMQHAPQTMLVASHDLELILEVCDRVLLLDGGRIVADGAAADIMGDDTLMTTHGLEKPHSLIPHEHPEC